MAEVSAKRCPDCGAPLMPIKLFARTPVNDQLNPSDGPVTRYTTPDAKRGWFVSQYDVAGRVSAMLCESCQRIFLYGHPGEGE
jgi:hypothetical protein